MHYGVFKRQFHISTYCLITMVAVGCTVNTDKTNSVGIRYNLKDSVQRFDVESQREDSLLVNDEGTVFLCDYRMGKVRFRKIGQDDIGGAMSVYAESARRRSSFTVLPNWGALCRYDLDRHVIEARSIWGDKTICEVPFESNYLPLIAACDISGRICAMFGNGGVVTSGYVNDVLVQELEDSASLSISQLYFCDYGRKILGFASNGKNSVCWNAESGKVLATREHLEYSSDNVSGVICVAASPTKDMLATGLSDGGIRVIRASTLEPIYEIYPKCIAPVWDISFSSRGSYIVSVTSTATCKYQPGVDLWSVGDDSASLYRHVSTSEGDSHYAGARCQLAYYNETAEKCAVSYSTGVIVIWHIDSLAAEKGVSD